MLLTCEFLHSLRLLPVVAISITPLLSYQVFPLVSRKQNLYFFCAARVTEIKTAFSNAFFQFKICDCSVFVMLIIDMLFSICDVDYRHVMDIPITLTILYKFS